MSALIFQYKQGRDLKSRPLKNKGFIVDREEFNALLEKANLSKKDFCQIIDLNYSAVNNWGTGDINIPKWVKSWLDNYVKAKDMDNIVEAVKPYIKDNIIN